MTSRRQPVSGEGEAQCEQIAEPVRRQSQVLLGVLGGPGLKPGRFSNPSSIALDSHGNLFVADSGPHREQKLIRRTPL